MTTIRRIAYAVLGIALAHLVFGAIVRITGSGMGCGDHWPKCYGYWFPPMTRMDLVIEVMHRYLASVLLLALLVLVVMAVGRRREPGVAGAGGVLRPALLALALGIAAALLGYVTVKLGNSPAATVGHWTVAMLLIAAVTAAVIRAGGFGGSAARRGGVSSKTRRGTLAAAALALSTVVLGGLTAKVEGGSVACLSFPLCGANPAVPASAVHVQGTHRVLAVLLVLHLVGLFFALRKRGEAPVIRRAAAIALGLGVVQMVIAGAMIGMRLPPVLRSLHEAVGVSIWVATFALAYLARLGSAGVNGLATPAPVPPVPAGPGDVPVQPEGTARQPADLLRAPAPTLRDGPRATVLTPAGASGIVPAVAAVHSALAAAPAPARRPDVAATVPPMPAPEPRAAARGSHDPFEQPAALHHALRVVTASALALHAVTAAAAMRAADDERAGQAAGVTRLATGQMSGAGDVRPVPPQGPGAPPDAHDTTSVLELEDLVTTRRTIFDDAADADDGAGDADDDDLPDEHGRPVPDEIESLDEAFNRQFLAAQALLDDATVPDRGAATVATRDAGLGVAAAGVHASVGAASTLVARSSPLCRPSMQHSVAVIVARGADF